MAGKRLVKPKAWSMGRVRVRAVRPPLEGDGDRWYWRAELRQGDDEVTVWAGRGTLEEAETEIAKVIAETPGSAPRGRRGDACSVGVLVDRWFAAQKNRSDLRPNSLEAYDASTDHLIAHLRDVLVTRVDQITLEAYRDTRFRLGAAPSTVRLELVTLGTVWRWGRGVGMVPADRELPKVQIAERAVRSRRTPSRDEFLRILEHARPGWPYKALRVLFATGCRLGELGLLRWRNVDLVEGNVFVPIDGKTGERTVPLDETVVKELRGWDWSDAEAWLIPIGRGTLRTNTRQELAAACDRARVPRITPHALRRLAVDELARAGVDVGSAAAMLGHSPAVMLQHYRGVTSEDQRAAIKAARLGRVPEGRVLPFGKASDDKA